MKKNFLLGSALFVGLALSSCNNSSNTKNSNLSKLSNEADSASYALGLVNGYGMSEQFKEMPGGNKLNKDNIIAGLSQGLKGDSANFKISLSEAETILREYFKKEHKEAEMKALLRQDSILRECDKSGMKKTESGLRYSVIVGDSTGAKPSKDDFVKVKYTGKLADGTIFDATSMHGDKPAEFPVAGVIPGWSEALQLMSVGSKWNIVIPSQLGYGARPIGNIPANSTLFFEVELLEILKKPAEVK